MPDDVGVRRAGIAILGEGIARVTIAVTAEERAAVFLLHQVSLGADVAAAKVNVAVVEAEHDDHALAVDEDIVASHRRILAIRAAAIKDAVEILGHFPVGDLAIVQVRLEAAWRAKTLVEGNIRETYRAYGRQFFQINAAHVELLAAPSSVRSKLRSVEEC